MLTISDKNFNEFCIQSLSAKEEKQDSKFFNQKLEKNYRFAFYVRLVLHFG